jgi:hypothetical protein
MTNLNTAVGMNKYCGPAVLSILTGKSTDECARVISSINGQYRVEGVLLTDLLRAADKLGFDQRPMPTGSNLYGTLVMHSNREGMYIFTLPNHFACIEVKDKKIYFCDNHTKEPMPAAGSARLMQKVLSVHKVEKRPDVVIPPKPPKEPDPEVSEELATPRIHILKGGTLEIDEARGVIYFHDADGVTVLRICHLPKPIPDPYDRPDGDTLLDITFGIGTSWGRK